MTFGHLALWAGAWAVLGAAHALVFRHNQQDTTHHTEE